MGKQRNNIVISQSQSQSQSQTLVEHEYPEFDHRSQLEHDLAKIQKQGLKQVLDFLTTKARKSPRTARMYYHGLENLSNFIAESYSDSKNKTKYDVQTIIPAIKKNKVDAYQLINSFINYLQRQNNGDLMPRTIALYVSAAKSYLTFYDIDILPVKFKNRVTLPSIYSADEAAIDTNDVRQILNHCNNRRLKAFILVLASSGARSMEALGLREKDINWNGIDFDDSNDTGEAAAIHIRKEYSKSKKDRDVFISNEAARYLNEWLNYKYRHLSNPVEARKQAKDDLIFSRIRHVKRYPIGLYNKLAFEFHRVLEAAGFCSRKENGAFYLLII
jgi:integrase